MQTEDSESARVSGQLSSLHANSVIRAVLELKYDTERGKHHRENCLWSRFPDGDALMSFFLSYGTAQHDDLS